MSSPHYPLEQQIQILQEENQALRAELAHIQARERAAIAAKAELVRGGLRVLLPLLDRQRVVRSFGKLASTASGFATPMAHWPTREQVLADAREFMINCVRFAVRRRLLLLIFSLVAATVPAIQLWLVIRQNEIIENQNSFFEIQVYDIVSRSMTEGDRNARQMTGALLANAKIEFLKGVIEEAFDPSQAGVYRAEGVTAATRRLEDAAFRGHLIRAVARGVELRAQKQEKTAEELHALGQPMFHQILRDTADRLPEVLRLGREGADIDSSLAEQVDNYLAQLGGMLRVYSRLARSAGQEKIFFQDVRPLFERLAGRRAEGGNRFDPVYIAVMQDFLFDLAIAPRLGEPAATLEARGMTPEQALRLGMERLQSGIGQDAINWTLLEQQLGAQ